MLTDSYGLVVLFIGSDSDYDTVKPALDQLAALGICYRLSVTSAHRSPERTKILVKQAEDDGASAIIAAAGCAAHLAGVVASETNLPVIGLPLDASSLNGLDALLATVQMPGGIPVATMAIGSAGAKNAALFAARILALQYPVIKERLQVYKEGMVRQVESKDNKLQERIEASACHVKGDK